MAARKSPNRQPRSAVAQHLPWVIAGAAGLGMVALIFSGRPGVPSHPDPRPDARSAAAGVMPPSFFAAQPRIMDAYQAARDVPETLDGLYCHCHCNRQVGHRSLLICFHSDHGAGCDICIEEAVMARQMVREGRSLADIRTAIDLAFGR